MHSEETNVDEENKGSDMKDSFHVKFSRNFCIDIFRFRSDSEIIDRFSRTRKNGTLNQV
jgi:hypothetical protein